MASVSTTEIRNLKTKRQLDHTTGKSALLKLLSKYVEDEPNFAPCTDDSFLIRFLVARGYDPSKAFATLLNFYRLKRKYSGLFTDFRPSQVEKVLDMNCMLVPSLVINEPNFAPCTDDGFLIRFLVARGYDPSKAFATLLNFYRLKRKYSGLFTDFRPSQVEKVLDMNCMLVLPLPDSDGSPVALMRFENFNEDAASPLELIAACYIAGVLGLEDERMQTNGCVLVCDTKGFNLKKMRKFFTPFFFKHFIEGIQMFPSLESCMPVRVKSLHMVNQTSYSRALFNIGKRFLKKNVSNRIFLHGSDLSNFHEHVPKDILPEELGGSQGPMDCQEYNSFILSKESHVDAMNKYGFQK